jgi:hypothetical protein
MLTAAHPRPIIRHLLFGELWARLPEEEEANPVLEEGLIEVSSYL